jgi:thiol-disulfide isomerase/thioredoxin
VAFSRPRRRAQVIALLAVVVAGAGALVWSRTIADDGDDVIVLDTPGEFVQPSRSNPPNDGAPLPGVELTTLDGSPTTLTVDGRPMVVNLWYSTCPPCARELSYLAAVHADFGDEVRFVGVNPLDDPDEMRRFATERGVDYELLVDRDGDLDDALRIVQYPVTLFVDADGEIVTQSGPLSEADLRTRIDELLA